MEEDELLEKILEMDKDEFLEKLLESEEFYNEVFDVADEHTRYVITYHLIKYETGEDPLEVMRRDALSYGEGFVKGLLEGEDTEFDKRMKAKIEEIKRGFYRR